ncbi:MAG: hydrogenase maturation nickel metallochaperone HypA [Myxococcales bacterium]|nr:hydrogenase maturation nickel metallochaperone HypA [Myxococcales bacterium]
MHEISLVHSLFDQADRAIAPHKSRAVRLMKVRIGELAGVDAGLFRTAFDGCRTERGYAAAALEIDLERAAWSCAACGAALTQGDRLRCTACDGEARLTKGGDLILDRLELEVVDV